MPDEYGFDRLGNNARCIEEGCHASGPMWEWPVERRRDHQQETHPGREHRTGGSTMSKKTASKVSGRTACIAALRAAGKPLTANEIASAVVDSGAAAGLKGKTPKATLSAQITSGAKHGEVFRRVGDGRPAKFALRDDAPEAPAELVEALMGLVNASHDGAASDGADVKPDPKPTSRRRRAAAAVGGKA